MNKESLNVFSIVFPESGSAEKNLADEEEYSTEVAHFYNMNHEKIAITNFNFIEDKLSFDLGLIKGVFNFVNSVGMGGSGAWSANSTNTEAMFDDVTDTLTIDTDGDGSEDMEIVMTNVNEVDLSPANFIFV